MKLTQLTPNQIQNGPVTIRELLKDSLYYPSGGFDGGVVKFFSKEVQSFIFAIMDFTKKNFLQKWMALGAIGFWLTGNFILMIFRPTDGRFKNLKELI